MINRVEHARMKAAEKVKLLDLYQDIWNERPHRSEVSNKWLGDTIKTTFFHHILPKNSNPSLKFDKNNIILLTFEEHQIVEHDSTRYEEVNKRRELLKPTKPVMREDYTHVSILLDRSGSMSTIAKDTIGGVNTFINEQKAQPGKMTLTMAQFDTYYDILQDARDIKEVPELTDKIFVPRGGTALFDSISRLIKSTGSALANLPEGERPAKVVMVIVTDGEENSSVETTRAQVAEMIKHQTDKYNWYFIYLGANQDAFAVGNSMGNFSGSNVKYTANSSGTRSMYNTVSSKMSDYRGMAAGASFSTITQDEIDTAEKEEEAKETPKKGTVEPNKP